MNKKITLGVFAHANAGKTTLTEQLLVRAGIIEKAGRVDFGNTITDDMKIEQERGITVRASLVSFFAGKNQFQLIDTPGHIDFVAEVERAMNVLDFAIVVISGVEGVEPQTYAILNTLLSNKIPLLVFINKMDRHGADLERVTAELHAKFNLTGVPIFHGSALRNEGIDNIFSFLASYEFLPVYSPALSVFVYQVRIENSIRRTYAKIFGGSLSKKQRIEIGDEVQKIDSILMPHGGKFIETSTATSGDIVILQGIELSAGVWIGQPQANKVLNFNKPLYTVSVSCDINKIHNLVSALKILTIEDPYLDVAFNEKSKQITINVMGEVQAEIIKEMLSERFGISAVLSDMSIIYKETPIGIGTGKASFTSVSRVEFEVAPLRLGSGIVYEETQAIIGSFSKNYSGKVKKLVYDYLKFGNFGWEVVDAKITLISAHYDHVGSEPMHFNVATPIALYRALRMAKTKILEPILSFKILIPQNLIGDIQKPLNLNNAVVSNSIIQNNRFLLEGKITELVREKLIKEIRNATHGLGECYFEFSHYGETNKFVKNDHIPYDPANETFFVQNIMQQSILLLDKEPRRKRKVKYANRKFEDRK